MCVQIEPVTSDFDCGIVLFLDRQLAAHETIDSRTLFATLVNGTPARAVLELADGSTVEATLTPLPGTVQMLMSAVSPSTLLIRSAITYDADGQQLQRLGRPPR
jgi:hypothetical protein